MVMMGFGGELMKAAKSKALVIKINLAFLGLFLVACVALLLQPTSLYGIDNAASCSLGNCHHLKKVQEVPKEEMPIFMESMHGVSRVGAVNMEEEEMRAWGTLDVVRVEFQRVSEEMEWKDLFPEWIDEEEENEGTSCPEVPMPDFSSYGEVDVVAARLPCRRPEVGWARDVYRLQVHLVVAEMAVRRGRRDGRGKVKVAVAGGGCRPMMEVFRCEELVAREGEWWVYEADVEWLAEKVGMPVGTCKLALPLWHQGTNEAYDPSSLAAPPPTGRREAYVTVIHSSDAYVCGAIVLAQSILNSGTTRDLLLLHDKSIPKPKLSALVAAGWTLREIKRIRNPHAEKDSYNEYNYSKLRLWQLTDYAKVVFVDSDIAVLRSLDILFRFPQLSAVGNDGVMFNSGIMVIEPSNCTFRAVMARRKDVVSYNGGDQGFLNEVFVWWHRLPRRVNFLKNFWSNKTAERVVKDTMFGADPPVLYAIHYLGFKPWLCYRDYDCNWNVGDHRVYASDVAHGRWWRVHDGMGEGLKGVCGLCEGRRGSLEKERKEAEERGIGDGHWRMEITEKRRRG